MSRHRPPRSPAGAQFSTGEDGNVSVVGLPRNNLIGEIPSEIKLLKYLRVLNLMFNESVTGVIPLEIGEMENLTELSLHHNSLTGPIPSVIANLTNLATLDLHHNQLTGPLPEWLGDLSNLSYLSVWGNDLTGSVPQLDCLGGVVTLRHQPEWSAATNSHGADAYNVLMA